MHPLEVRLRKTIEQNELVRPGDSVIVAISGGPDSVALLHLLLKTSRDCTFIGAHINHNLRPDDATSERELVEKLCRMHDIPFAYASVDVAGTARKNHLSIEDCARSMRYKALEEIRIKHDADLVAVGHTRDDQAEQFLIRLIRGSGLKGLGGMNYKRGSIVRPLLETSKEELVSYLSEAGADYCIDTSNKSHRFLRNRIRLDLLPLLEKDFNPAIRQTIVNTMTVLRDEEAYLEGKTACAYRSIVSLHHFKDGLTSRVEHRAALGKLMACHPALRRRIYEKLCWDFRCRPTFKMISSIESLRDSGRNGSSLHLPGNIRVIKGADSLIFTLLPDPSALQDLVVQTGEPEIIMPGTGTYTVPHLGTEIILQETVGDEKDTSGILSVDGDLVDFPLVLRKPHPGERFRPLGAPGRKSVSRFLSDRKIPRHLRYRFPVLLSKDRIVALPGLTIDDSFKTGPGTNRFLQIRFKND